jgi:hypothetical protein
MAVGKDMNVDTVQLGNHASGLTEVAIILAQHPEWDRGPRRLQLPVITKDSSEITMKAVKEMTSERYLSLIRRLGVETEGSF